MSGVVELIGPAGSGKSALHARLASEPWARPAGGIWGLPRARLAARAVRLAPLAAAAAISGRPLSAGEWAQMSRAEALHWAESRCDTPHDVVRVLDEGPIFTLAWLSVFHDAARGSVQRRWRERTLAAWAPLLRAVVWIDADDATLAQRIRAREKQHMMKDATDMGIREFTSRFRLAFDRVLSELWVASPIPVVTLRSDTMPVSRLASAVASSLRGRYGVA